MLPDLPSAAAKEGTAAHEIVASRLEAGTDDDDPNLQAYLDTVRSYPGKRLVEHRVEIVPGLCWGTLDAGILNPGGNTVVDFKYGVDPVAAVNNPQLMLYALGLHALAPTDDYELVIVQPRASSGWPVKRWSTTSQYLMLFGEKVLRAIDRAEKPTPIAMAGKHCYWCKAKLYCQEYLMGTSP
jgi:hypothetical protein